MPTLRLIQSTAGPDRYRVQVSLDGDARPPLTATAEFAFSFSDQDREDLRWYLEDYLEHAADPAPKIATRIEQRIAEMGAQLFHEVFESSKTADRLWSRLQNELNDTRVEVVADVQTATAIPWELLRDPLTETPLALEAQAFVRAQTDMTRVPKIPQQRGAGDEGTEAIRILLVICRPGGSSDVPFRSVASRLIKGLGGSAHEAFELDVLRPPTFEQLGKVLRAAKAAGKPYHVVHFDGHGTYQEVSKPSTLAAIVSGLRSHVLSSPRAGAHGYLLFENPAIRENLQLVDGPSLGRLLTETDVPVLVLNACRSAHAEAPAAPEKKAEAEGESAATQEASEVHTQVRAFGSLAQEVVGAGVAGVVAMRYNVYVVTAAQFVADLYGALVQGQTLGEAVTLGRKQLHDQPLREIAYEPRPLQDWPVPVVYEAALVALFPKPTGAAPALHITLKAGEAAPAEGSLDPNLPAQPDAGFFGRDETLLALDRAFDNQSIVLLHAYAGSGKTATAAEFARWYSLTGGIEGPVLFTSFEQYKPLTRVLDTIGQVFGQALEGASVHWLTLDDEQRRDVALQVLGQIPVLWIWDNVEPIAGFPAGAESPWSGAEQKELADFLRAARETRARFLLTSRRDERGWLGALPARIQVPAMPMQERVQLARALAEKHGRRLTEVEDWRPLLRFTQGNPLTITVLVGQALRDGLRTREQIQAFVARLQAGESAFDDEVSEGRSKSLGASLSYGFEHAFSEEERKQLALLHCFQGFVNVQVLQAMGNSEAPWCLPEVRGLTQDAGIALLDRAAEVGLLSALGGGYYIIHPALPWFFKSLFAQRYPGLPPQDDQHTGSSEAGTAAGALRAFVEAIGELGDFYMAQYVDGNRGVVGVLSLEESNLLFARHLARTHGWWVRIISTMQGLRSLYEHTGRRGEWARLVEEIVPDFVDPATDGPLLGREEQWGLVTDYRVRLAWEARQWEQAERLLRATVEWDRQQAASALALSPEALDAQQRNTIRTLGALVHALGQIQRERGEGECAASYQEALSLFERIGDRAAAANCAANLGIAHTDLPALRDLSAAERWYRRSLELFDARDGLGRAKCNSQLGSLSHERFKEARRSGRPEPEQLDHLRAAADFYHEALQLLPADAVNELAVIHTLLGNIYSDAGELERALSHYRQAIGYNEATGNLYEAAGIRKNIAFTLARAGRLADAREYAYAALRNYETFGDRAAAEMEQTRQLIAAIEQALQS